MNELTPVILVLYDARRNMAYWLYIQRHFVRLQGFDLQRAGERISVSIPTRNVLDRQVMKSLARVKNVLVKTSQGVIRHEF